MPNCIEVIATNLKKEYWFAISETPHFFVVLCVFCSVRDPVR